MRILISGSRGLIGTALGEALVARGDEVVRLRRGPSVGEGELAWNPLDGTIDAAGIVGVDAVVHLAGESIFGRWTAAKKQAIRDSRVVGTTLVARTLARMPSATRPRVLVVASAIGWYGDRGDEVLTESSAPGRSGFLAEVVREWEAAADAARDAGIRTVHVRTGIVQSRSGGALATQLLPFRLGIGGPLGLGGQWLSWVSLADTIGAYRAAIDDGRIDGALNATAPEPVTARDYARTLGRVLHRPAVIPVPRIAIRVALGGLADELYASQRVVPQRLLQLGYTFQHPELEPALRELLDRE